MTPRSPILVEDLDTIEARRRKRGKGAYSLRDLFAKPDPEDPQVWRRLGRFALPYRSALIAALCMSAFGATARLGFIIILKYMFEPIFDPREPLIGLASAQRAAGIVLSIPEGLPDFVRGLLLHLAIVVDGLGLLWSRLEPSEQLGWASLMLVVLVIIEQINKYAQRLIMRSVSLDVIRAIRAALFDRLMTLSMRFFHANHSGKLISRLTNDLNNLGALLVDVLVELSTDVFVLLGALIYLYVADGEIVLYGVAIALVSFVPIQQLSRRIRRKEGSNQQRMGSLFAALSETLAAMKIIKVFTGEEHERQRFKLVNEANTEGRKKSAALRARIQPVVEIIGVLGVALFAWIGGQQVFEGRWTPTDFLVIVMLLVNSVGAVRRLGDTNSKISSGLASADRVATVLYSEPEISDAPDAVPLDGLRESIVFEDVCYSHDKVAPVLQQISFELPRGRTLALVGHTGSGKSTLADLVPRLFDVDIGAVRIDGRDVRTLQLASLRRQVAMVTQDTLLFRDSVADNIAYAMPDMPRERIEAAARAAQAHDFIARLPEGYDTVLGERGTKLSGGERQRLAIARAILKDAPILILDEATSALDSASEALVQTALENLKAGRTTIVIAHRLSTIRDADMIFVLENGCIVERGTHDELLAAGGHYARMIEVQHRR